MMLFPILQEKPAHPPRTSQKVSLAPVTAREAQAAFGKLGSLLQKVGGVAYGPSSIVAEDRAATRTEIVAEMMRFYRAAEPTFRFIPALVPYSASMFKIDAAQKLSLSKLVSRGCIGRIAPLAVGPDATLTPKEFGDALGFFSARLMQMSHLPSPEFTPSLQEG